MSGTLKVYDTPAIGFEDGGSWSTSEPGGAGTGFPIVLGGGTATEGVGLRFTLGETPLIFSASLLVEQVSVTGPITIHVDIEKGHITTAFGASPNLPSEKTSYRRVAEYSDSSTGSITGTITIPLNPGAFNPDMNQTDWDGSVNIRLTGTAPNATGDGLVALDSTTLSTMRNVVTNGAGFSSGNRVYGERWLIDPREGFPHPASQMVRDGEQRSLFVHYRYRDEPGRRDTRQASHRERETRLWPAV